MGIHHLGMIAGVFHGRERIGVTADRVELLGNLIGGPLSGTFKNHVLNKMRQPVFRRVFITGTDINPDPHGHRKGMRHFLG